MAAITETRLNLFSWGPIDRVNFSKNERERAESSREQELTGTDVARKIAKESGRGLKKEGENFGK